MANFNPSNYRQHSDFTIGSNDEISPLPQNITEKPTKISGYLDKLSNFGFSWNKRYVVYDGETFSVANTEDSPVKLSFKVSAAASSFAPGVTTSLQFVFSVKNNDDGKEYLFGCESEAVRKDWIDAINDFDKFVNAMVSVLSMERERAMSVSTRERSQSAVATSSLRSAKKGTRSQSVLDTLGTLDKLTLRSVRNSIVSNDAPSTPHVDSYNSNS